MKKLSLLGALVLLATSIGAQSPATDDQQRLAGLLAEVQDQQTQIAANQAQIDSKLASLGEAIRVARIYASRSGGH